MKVGRLLNLTAKSRYAVTAMLDLAAQNKEKPVSLADISRRQEISLSYLEQLFAKLRKNGLVKSIKGPGGGYLLADLLTKYPSPTLSIQLMRTLMSHVVLARKLSKGSSLSDP